MTNSNCQAVQKLTARLARLEEQFAKVQGKFVIVRRSGQLAVRLFGTREAMAKLLPTIKTTSHYEQDSWAYIIPAEEFMRIEMAKCEKAIRFFFD